MNNLSENAYIIEKKLKEFGVNVKVIRINKGPIITQYQLFLEKGQKANIIKSLSLDLTMVLKVNHINVVTPISGTNLIGIEVPNEDKELIKFENIINTIDNDMKIPLLIGKDICGKVKSIDLVNTPHLLIAGSTGSGKSVAINSFISSIISKKTPEEVNFVLIDPKVVELMPYNNIPHIIGDVITEPSDAVKSLKWVIYEMERRYKLLANINVRNIENYNEKQEKLPYIVVIVDELADLMMTTKKEVESSIVRIAQKARAIGIHLILTTQRPDRKIITGLIKANVPARIGFKVASQIDSKIIIDGSGCEKLLGNGDMFLKQNNNIERLHGAFIDDNEINNIISSLPNIKKPNEIKIKEIKNNDSIEQISIYKEALKLMKKHNRLSASFLQRRLDINYILAEKIINKCNFL